MKTKRLLSILLAISVLFSSIAVVFYSTSLAIAEETGDKTDLIDAVYVGKSGTTNPVIANIFFPLTVNKATPDAEETFNQHNTNNPAATDQVYFKLTFKAKMFSGGIYRNKSGVIKATDLGPVVGFVSYDVESKKPAVSSSDVQSMRPKPAIGSKNHSYSYDPETGICEVVFKPTLKGNSSDNGIYGAVTIGNAEHSAISSASDVLGETDFDASFIVSEPELYAYDINTKSTYGDNLFQDGEGNPVGFESNNVDTNSTFRIDEPNYTEKDSMLTAPRYKWHIDTGDSLIEKVKVPADYITSSNYDAANFVKHDETDYTREYYTNDNYSAYKFTCLKNSDNKAFGVVEDINKKMIVISANGEGMPEGSYGNGYTNSNRYANLMLPLNADQFTRPLDQSYPPGARIFFKVTMTAKRLAGDGAPLLGRFYGESNVAKTSNGTSYSYNVGEADSGAGNEAGLPKNTYNPDTGEFVGYVRSYTNDTDHDETSSGHNQWITIGNAEHKGDLDMFWSTCFNSSFAITDIKVDLYSYDNNGVENKLGVLIAEDIAPGLFEETIDNENPRCYGATNRSKDYDFDKYDATNSPQKQWSVDGAIDLVHTYDVTKCVVENHTKNFTHTEISSTNLDSWYCSACDTYFEDSIGVKAIGTTAEVTDGNLLGLSKKMVHIKGESDSPAYLAIPLKLTGFTGHAYYKFSCTYKNLGNTDPIIRIYEARSAGQKGGATPDITATPISQEFDPDTMMLNVMLDVWRPAKSEYAPFSFAEPDTGANFVMLIGNSELVGDDYNAVKANFSFTDPKMVRMNGDTVSSGEKEGANPVNIAPVSDKTVVIDSPYALGNYKDNSYYDDENSPLTAKLNRWYDLGGKSGGDIQIEDIPDRYFAVPHSVAIKNTNATISVFKTVTSGKTYNFYYDGSFKSIDVPKPFVDFISAGGDATRKYLDYTRDVNGRYCFTSNFTVPDGLRASRNIRIGIDVDSTDINGRVANFSLTEVSESGDNLNLIEDGNLIDTKNLVEYSADADEGIFMYEGNIGDTVIGEIMGSLYVIPVPFMATFIGKNKDDSESVTANDGKPYETAITQNFTLEKGKKYRVSYNVKYISKGYAEYGSKVGAELKYISTSGEKLLNVPLIDSDTEYRETYEFTMPEDTAETDGNFTFAFNFWGAFVSGQIANFTLFEIDETGNAISTNMFVQGEFSKGEYTPGWNEITANYTAFSFSEVPENYFSKVTPYDAQMLAFEKTDDWSWFTFSPMLKPNTKYEWCYNRIYSKYDSDKKPYTVSSMFKPDNTTMSTEDFFEIKSYDTFESKKFKTDANLRLYGGNNMILRYYMRKNSEGYYGNLALYELNEDGERISGNLFVNGNFACGKNIFEWSQTDMSLNRIETIPNGFFDMPSVIDIKNTNAKISTFAKIESGKTYNFSYEGKFTSAKVPKPFVEFYLSGGTTQKKYLDYTRNSDGRYNFSSSFTAPSSLKSAKNLRIGIDVNSTDIEGSVAKFSLTETSTENEILKNGSLFGVEKLIAYSSSAKEGEWTYEGNSGDAAIDVYSDFDFKITVPNMVTFAGKNEDTDAAKNDNDGRPRKATLTQNFTVKPGKKYRISYNVKYVSKGYAQYNSKVGGELTYLSTSGKLALDAPVTKSDTEYRETYEFEMPDDTKIAVNNLTFSFNFWGAFVSGYIANFTMYEIDAGGKTVGKNMFVQGDFPDATYNPGWNTLESGSYYLFEYSQIPENFFSKVTPFKAKMLVFEKTDDWSWFTYSPMLKPNTNYEWCYNRIYTKYNSSSKPYTIPYMFKPTNTAMGNDDFFEINTYDTFESKKFRTDANVRLYGGNNMILRYYMRKNSEGYYANLGLYELDGNGNRISGNLYLNGDFGIGKKCFEWSNTQMDYNRFEEIPDGLFDLPSKLTIKDTKATISTFSTVKSNKTYTFCYDGRFESDNVPKPFVEYISAGGSTKRAYLSYSRNVDGRYNFESTFTVPAGLKSSKNIRIGIDVDSKDIEGSVANFTLIESTDSDETNLIKDGEFLETSKLVPYSASVAEGVWMYEGDLGDVSIELIDFLSSLNFKITTPNMVSFAGKNEENEAAKSANDGRPCKAILSQDLSVEKGKTYRISYNVKYVNKGYEEYGSKVGAEITYKSNSGIDKKISASAVESDTEYRETYEFKMPSDTKAILKNLRFSFNFWGSFVSGQIANFTMYELDAEGNPVGKNMFVQGDFPDATYNPGWNTLESGSYYLFEYSQIPENFFSKVTPYKAKMLAFEKTDDWSWFTYSPMLKPNTNYEWCYDRIYTKFDADKEPYTIPSMFKPNADGVITNTTMSTSDFFDIKSYDTNESKKFKTDPGVRLYGGNNMILRFYMRKNSEGYYGNLGLYELDENGERVSGNLFLNGDFAAETKCFEWSDTNMSYNTFVEIPDGFFDSPTEFDLKNTDAVISTFATVQSGKTYTFYYDGKFESSAVAKPFVDFIYANGNVVRKYLEYDRDINGRYNFQSIFIPPTGLKSSKNIRIGIDVDSKDIVGSVANFSLYEIDAGTTGENIFTNGKLINVLELTPYSASVDEGIWMYEGDLGDAEIGTPVNTSYIIPVPTMVSFVGKNKNSAEAEKANDGRPYEANLSQSFTLKKGKSYRFSFNVKYVNKGYEEYGSKVGAEFSYINELGKETVMNIPVQESETEYRETYDFKMPEDTKETSNNLKFVFNFWGSFVSGQIANFTLYELDDSKNPVGDNLVVHGDFAGETYYPGWSLSNYTEWTKWQYADIPENFFSKTTPFKNRMLYFHSTEDWTWFSTSPMLKPNTNYEWCYNRIYTDFTTDKKPYTVASMFYPNADGVMTNTSMSESFYDEIVSTDTFESKKFKTDAGVRLYGGNNMIMRIWMRAQSAGYYGNFQLYELDENGNRISGNLYTNGGFGADYDCWETDSTKPLDYVRIVEIPDGFFDSVPAQSTMIVSKGTAKNAKYTFNATVDKYKKNFLQFRYVGMNSSGVTPEIMYPAYDADGKVVYKTIQVNAMYDSDLYYYEAAFNLPADAISAEGKTDIKIVFNNTNKGKGYFADVSVYEEGKYVNLIKSSSADKSGNFEVVPYDSGVFIFYYDDTKFDDGDWSGELSANDFLISTGNVYGNLVDYDFNPIKGATVRLEPGGHKTKTDKDGYYTFTKLKPGKYKLYLDINNESLYCFEVTVEKGMIYNAPEICYKAPVEAVVETVYPQTQPDSPQNNTNDTGSNTSSDINTNPADFGQTTTTTTITTTTTTTTSSLPTYDDTVITTNPSDAGEITGVYYSREGKPIANVKIYITKSVFAVTDKDGRFEFTNLKPNTYKLYVRIDGRFYELRDVTVQAQKRISIKVMEPDIEDGDYGILEAIEDFFVDYTLYAVLACIGIALLIAAAIIIPIILVKRKKRVI